jgi:hypothetical protein
LAWLGLPWRCLVLISCLGVCLVLLPLPCLALFLSCLALPCLVLSCLVLSCLVLFCLVLSCLVLYCPVLSYPVLSCLSWFFFSCIGCSCGVCCLVFCCLAVSCLVLSCFASPSLSCLLALIYLGLRLVLRLVVSLGLTRLNKEADSFNPGNFPHTKIGKIFNATRYHE